MCGHHNVWWYWLRLGHRLRGRCLGKSVPGINESLIDGWCCRKQAQRQDGRDKKQQRSWQSAQQEQATSDQPVGIVEASVLVGKRSLKAGAVLARRRLLDSGFGKANGWTLDISHAGELPDLHQLPVGCHLLGGGLLTLRSRP